MSFASLRTRLLVVASILIAAHFTLGQDPPKKKPEAKSVFKAPRSGKILIIDGDFRRERDERGDTFYFKHAIDSIPKSPYQVVQGADTSATEPARALEGDLSGFGAIVLMNVSDLTAKQIANLEAFATDGGGVAFFMGPRVNSALYNKELHRDGKGIFPVPLGATYHPPAKEKPLQPSPNGPGLLIRDDLFVDSGRVPIFSEVFPEPRYRAVLDGLPIHRYFKVDRAAWKPAANRSTELATLPNNAPTSELAKQVAAITRGDAMKALHEDKNFKIARQTLDRHTQTIENLVMPGAETMGTQVARAIEVMLMDEKLRDLWKDPRARPVVASLVHLRQQASFGDPLVVAGRFGDGRIIAVMTTAGKEWTDFPGGCLASVAYAPFIWETLNYLTHRSEPEKPKMQGKAGPPRLFDLEPRVGPRSPLTKKDLPDKVRVYQVTPDARIPFRGTLRDPIGLSKAHWIVQVATGKDVKPKPELRIPLEQFAIKQRQRAFHELVRDVLADKKDRPFPTGNLPFYSLDEEPGLDFRKHLGRLKEKDASKPQGTHLVKVWLEVEGHKGVVVRSEAPMLFVIGSENEVRAQAYYRMEKLADHLEDVLDRFRNAEVQLAEQAKRLTAKDADREIIKFRVQETRTSVQYGAGRCRDVYHQLDRTVQELEFNRVGKDTLDRHRLLAALAEEASDDKNYGDLDAGLLELANALDKGKADDLRKQIETNRARLKTIQKDLMAAADRLNESIAEARLVGLLVEIERRQREELQKLEKLRPSIDDLLKELLKDSPKKK